jgi:hypothetical protein
VREVRAEELQEEIRDLRQRLSDIDRQRQHDQLGAAAAEIESAVSIAKLQEEWGAEKAVLAEAIDLKTREAEINAAEWASAKAEMSLELEELKKSLRDLQNEVQQSAEVRILQPRLSNAEQLRMVQSANYSPVNLSFQMSSPEFPISAPLTQAEALLVQQLPTTIACEGIGPATTTSLESSDLTDETTVTQSDATAEENTSVLSAAAAATPEKPAKIPFGSRWRNAFRRKGRAVDGRNESKSPTNDSVNSTAVLESKLADLEFRISELTSENSELSGQLAISLKMTQPSSAGGTNVTSASDVEAVNNILRSKLAELETQFQDLTRENVALKDELCASLESAESSAVDADAANLVLQSKLIEVEELKLQIQVCRRSLLSTMVECFFLFQLFIFVHIQKCCCLEHVSETCQLPPENIGEEKVTFENCEVTATGEIASATTKASPESMEDELCNKVKYINEESCVVFVCFHYAKYFRANCRPWRVSCSSPALRLTPQPLPS